jgi:hypothetical protein
MGGSLVSRTAAIASGVLVAALASAQNRGMAPPPDRPGVVEATRVESPNWGTSGRSFVRLNGLAFNTDGGHFTTTGSFGRYPSVGGLAVLAADVRVPNGSIIDYLEIDFCDNLDPEDIQLTLFDCDPVTGCTTVANVNSFANPGCSVISTSNFSHVVDNTTSSLGLVAHFDAVASFELELRGAVVGYHLQVSPAPATATFTDVPTTDQYFQFIEALAASGITSGCNVSPPQFCPDRPITRAEMAVFLAKALGLNFP